MLIGETGFVLCVVQHSKWRTSVTFYLIALPQASFELVIPSFFSLLVQYLMVFTLVKQMHVVESLGTVFLLRAISIMSLDTCT